MGSGTSCFQAKTQEKKTNNVKKNEPLEIKWNNQTIFGLDKYNELGKEECEEKFKNRFEVAKNLKLTKQGLLLFYKMQAKIFPEFNQENNTNFIYDYMEQSSQSMVPQYKTFMVRMLFPGMADRIDYFLNAIFDIKVRIVWDTKLENLSQIGFIQKENMILVEEESD